MTFSSEGTSPRVASFGKSDLKYFVRLIRLEFPARIKLSGEIVKGSHSGAFEQA